MTRTIAKNIWQRSNRHVESVPVVYGGHPVTFTYIGRIDQIMQLHPRMLAVFDDFFNADRITSSEFMRFMSSLEKAYGVDFCYRVK